MKRQRGNADLYVALAILVALGLIFGGFAWWLSREKAAAFEAGKAEVQAQWDLQRLEDAEIERRRNKAVSDALAVLAAKVALAESKAAQSDDDLKEERRANRGKQLGTCEQPGADQAPADDAGRDVARAGDGAGASAGRGVVPAGMGPRAPGIHLLWRFVGLHDGGFTGLDGQPLFGASHDYALDPGRADAASPYTLDDVLDVANENARKLSACRRDVAKARSVVEAAANSWGRASE